MFRHPRHTACCGYFLPFFALAAVFWRLGAAAFGDFAADESAAVETFFTPPVLPACPDAFTTLDLPRVFWLLFSLFEVLSSTSALSPATPALVFCTPPPRTSVARRSGPGSVGTRLPTGTCSTITWPARTSLR